MEVKIILLMNVMFIITPRDTAFFPDACLGTFYKLKGRLKK